MKKILTVLFAVICFQASAQNNRCGTSTYLEKLKAKDVSLSAIMAQRNATVQQRLLSGHRITQVITIPVVFHVVYKTAAQNITDARLQEQLDVLNNDYARNNQDALSTPPYFMNLASGTLIQFCLAKRDPNGKPTTGIERKKTTVDTFDFDEVKSVSTGGLNAWPSTSYLNIWSCNLGDNLLGFGTLPNTATPGFDGVVIAYSTVGGPDAVGTHPVYNLGRTLTHEVGHWLNLSHIWGDDGGACTGDDDVNDTPVQASEHFGFPVYPSVSCNNGPDGDMFMNFLDYSDDLAMNSFSAGQKARMEDALMFNRSTIAGSLGCTAPAQVPADAAITDVLYANKLICTNYVLPSVVIKNVGTGNINSATFSYALNDDTPLQKTWTGSLAPNASVTVNLDSMLITGAANILMVIVAVTNDGNLSNNQHVSSFTQVIAGLPLPYFQDFENKRFPNDSCFVVNENNDNGTWMRTRMASKTSNSSLWIFSPSTTLAGTFDDFILEPLDLTSTADPLLAFDIAYANDVTSPDHTLEIFASVDCGNTFTEIYSKSGSQLATTPISTPSYFIPSASQWRKDTVGLSGYAGFNNVILKLRSIAGNENGMYVDNLKVARFGEIFTNASGINFAQLSSPGKGLLHFAVKLLKDSSCNISVYNLLGQKVVSEDYLQSYVEYPSGSSGKVLPYLRKGIYIVQVTTPSEKKSFKIFHGN